MSEDFQHISVGLNQMLATLRRKMDENKTVKVVKPPPGSLTSKMPENPVLRRKRI